MTSRTKSTAIGIIVSPGPADLVRAVHQGDSG